MFLAVRAALMSMALATQDLQIPSPTGYVNDFAGVIGSERASRIERIIEAVRSKSKGEIVVVTLSDIGDRDVGQVALQIGRQWKVGAAAEVGDKSRNAGTVILVVPKESSSDGKGHISIQTGNGVEGFITDSRAGNIRREAVPFLQQKDYGAALELITARVAEAYAGEFGFDLGESVQAPRPPPSRGRGRSGQIPAGFYVILFFIVLSMLRGRGGGNGCLWFLLGQAMSGGRRGGFGGGGGWSGGGGGGFGGGGFGGFGGGGGFSGGGSSGSW